MVSISKAKLAELETTIRSLTYRLERSEKQVDEWKEVFNNILIHFRQ